MTSDDNGGLAGLAKRWLRSKKTELLTGDRRTREQAEVEAHNTQRKISDAVVGEAVMSAFPGLRHAKERQERARAEREEAERDATRALPRAGLQLQASGAAHASWAGTMGADVQLETDDDDEEGGGGGGSSSTTLRVELATVDEDAPVVGSARLFGWRFAVPGYQGPGRYDLAAINEQLASTGGELDPSDFELALGHREEPFYWTPDTGPGVIVVAGDGRTLTLDLAMSGASGDLLVHAVVTLPGEAATA
jgi:hypothetical protein